MELKVLTLEAIKTQCRIDPEEDYEDGILQIYGAAAEDMVFNMINRSFLECLDEWGSPDRFPAPLTAAMLVLTAQSYKYREATSPEAINKVPYGVTAMLSPYVKLTERV